MRFMVMIKATPETEAGDMPSTEAISAMQAYNEELVKAGVLLAADGLHASSKGARVRFAGGTTSVFDGPFTEAKELVAGFWIIQARSREEALEWVKRVPHSPDEEFEVEVRQVFEADEFGDAATPEIVETDRRHRAEVEKNR